MATGKIRAPRNRTVDLDPGDAERYRQSLISEDQVAAADTRNRIICGDAFHVLEKLPPKSIDLLFADPPYNLSKSFGNSSFKQTSSAAYGTWLETWIQLCVPLLKPTASIYICGDWRSSSAIQNASEKFFVLRNRITWEREKGRGAKANWKNAAEDIWFSTVSDKYAFNVDAVKQRRRVLAPYRKDGQPKDWSESENGNFRDTHPSNLWTDISVPFWSMPENTDHPTQKPEKLLAKIILASTNTGDRILDPFGGSGTTAVVPQKLGRDFTLIESDETYCLLAQKRLEMAGEEPGIQGFVNGVFWDRNANPTA